MLLHLGIDFSLKVCTCWKSEAFSLLFSVFFLPSFMVLVLLPVILSFSLSEWVLCLCVCLSLSFESLFLILRFLQPHPISSLQPCLPCQSDLALYFSFLVFFQSIATFHFLMLSLSLLFVLFRFEACFFLQFFLIFKKNLIFFIHVDPCIVLFIWFFSCLKTPFFPWSVRVV